MGKNNARFFDSTSKKFVDSRMAGIKRNDTTKLTHKMQQGLRRNVITGSHSPFPFRRHSFLAATYKHSGDIGDLLYSLPLIKETGGGTLYLSTHGLGQKGDGTRSGFDDHIINFIKPLLSQQSYIKKVEKHTHEKVNIDIDMFRKINMKSSNLCSKILLAFSVPLESTNKPWIQCDEKKVAKAIFARSFRYRNDNINYAKFMTKHDGDCVFVGLPQEHKDFVSKFGDIKYYPVKDLLEMAEVIKGCEMFYGNQSSPMALAIGLGKSYTQEVFLSGPDCIFNRDNATYVR